MGNESNNNFIMKRHNIPLTANKSSTFLKLFSYLSVRFLGFQLFVLHHGHPPVVESISPSESHYPVAFQLVLGEGIQRMLSQNLLCVLDLREALLREFAYFILLAWLYQRVEACARCVKPTKNVSINKE